VLSYGGSYNKVGPDMMLRRYAAQFLDARMICVPVGLLYLARGGGEPTRETARPWLLAFLGATVYKPVSPIPAPYLDTPLLLIVSLLTAVSAGLVRSRTDLAASIKVAAVLWLVALGVNPRPAFCDAVASLRAVSTLRTGIAPRSAPPGYTVRYVRKPYAWDDYSSVVSFLRSRVPPTTRVANLLKHDPAITGPAGRLPALPAESVAWIRMVNAGDEPRFAEALEKAGDSVVVWSPEEVDNGEKPELARLTPVVMTYYEPSRRFGAIEVWTRRARPLRGATVIQNDDH
jgi:hypothetical protein